MLFRSRYPSRFLLDINQSLLTFTLPPQEGLIQAAKDYIDHAQIDLRDEDSNSLMEAGQRVKHSTFGLGTVQAVDIDKGAYLVQFDELQTPRKISFRARLEPV